MLPKKDRTPQLIPAMVPSTTFLTLKTLFSRVKFLQPNSKIFVLDTLLMKEHTAILNEKITGERRRMVSREMFYLSQIMLVGLDVFKILSTSSLDLRSFSYEIKSKQEEPLMMPPLTLLVHLIHPFDLLRSFTENRPTSSPKRSKIMFLVVGLMTRVTLRPSLMSSSPQQKPLSPTNEEFLLGESVSSFALIIASPSLQ